MILHIAIANKGQFEIVLEFGEDILQRFVENIGQHVEAATMGHPHNQITDPSFCGLHQQGVQEWNDGLSTFQ